MITIKGPLVISKKEVSKELEAELKKVSQLKPKTPADEGVKESKEDLKLAKAKVVKKKEVKK